MNSANTAQSGTQSNTRTGTVAGVHLIDDEEILADFKPGWYALLDQIIGVTLVTILTAGLAFPLYYIPWKNRRKTRYIVTNGRIIKKTSTWRGGSTDETVLRDIGPVDTHANTIQQYLDVGTIQFSVAGEHFEWTGVPNYGTVAASIREQRRDPSVANAIRDASIGDSQ